MNSELKERAIRVSILQAVCGLELLFVPDVDRPVHITPLNSPETEATVDDSAKDMAFFGP